jgi:tetratricopeptide (TPR) repeat protein
MEFFREGIATYGVDRKALGIDLIMEEWIGRSRSAESEVAQGAWKDMAALLAQAEKNRQPTLALRLKRLFLFAPDITADRKQALMTDLMKVENLTNASPGVLELMLDEARRTTNNAFGIKIAETMIRTFTETDYALSARMYLAQVAMDRKDYPAAIKHLTVIREVFATSGEAAEALMLLGDLYIRQNKLTDADECYKSVLGVREWRGPLWPAALYGRGECARLQRNDEQAAAYYERIDLLYNQYRDWTAKAYLARANALTRCRQYQKAIETLTEMVGLADLSEAPEMPAARKQLEELKRQGS